MLAVLLLLVAGCGSAQEQSAREVASQFYSAIAQQDGPGACAILAPKTVSELERSAHQPCAEAILGEGIPDVEAPDEVEVHGTMAQLRYGNETAFLTRFPDGWRVLAAACTPTAGPYDCRVKGA